MRFDGYAGTVRGFEFSYVAEALATSLNGIVARGRPRRRYGQVLDVDVDGRQAAWVGWDEGNGTVYFEGKGETSPSLVKGVRVHFRDAHTVARADVCEDYDAPGAFEQLQALIRSQKGERVHGGYVALPDDPEQGRTWCAGVRGGVSMVRVYEAGKMRDRLHYGRPGWVRCELEARPHYARDKAAAAHMEPLHFWGIAAWSHRVGQALAQVEIPRFEPEQRTYSTDKTGLYIARTFRRWFETQLADGIDVMRQFQEVWEQDDAQAEASENRRPN